MTYNNTIWDKLQPWIVKVKRWLILAAIIGIIISSFNNIFKQYTTLVEAKKENQKLAEKIQETEKENKILIQKIEYATSSAFIEEEARDKLGLGNKNDYWVNMSTDTSGGSWYPFVNIGDTESTLKQWINLFTR